MDPKVERVECGEMMSKSSHNSRVVYLENISNYYESITYILNVSIFLTFYTELIYNIIVLTDSEEEYVQK